MTQKQAFKFLESRITLGWKLELDTMHRLLAESGNPHERVKHIHIAGTNGKGTVAAIMESVLIASGYRAGLYTSPHLRDVRERIRLNGKMIPIPDFVRIIARIQPMIEKYGATYFETLTAVALIYFAEAAEVAVLEVGLGGRLDATNVVVPIVSIITSISYDHTEHLGATLTQIAAEKGGILKSGVPCVCGELPADAARVIAAMAGERSVAMIKSADQFKATITREYPGWTHFDVQGEAEFSGSFSLPLNGAHQVQNALIAASACTQLRQKGWKISRDSFAQGLLQTQWPGRFQIVGQNPTIIVDVAHNPASFDQLVRVIHHFYKLTKIFFIIGLLKDKDFKQITKMVAGIASVVQPVTPDTPRALAAEVLADQFAQMGSTVLTPGRVAEGIDAVLKIAEPESTICIAGSHYVVGEALNKIKGLTR